VRARDIGRARAALAGHLRATQQVVLAALTRPKRAAEGRRTSCPSTGRS
jgi:hypothetical protein